MNEYSDLSSLHKCRTELPNILFELDLDPYEFRVYCQIKKITGDGGKCWMSMRALAEKCNISERKLREVKKSLSQPIEQLGNIPLLKITKRKKEKGDLDTDLIEIIDIWPVNFQKSYSAARHAGGVQHDMLEGAARHADKKDPIEKDPSIRRNIDITKKKSMPFSKEKIPKPSQKNDYTQNLDADQLELFNRITKLGGPGVKKVDPKEITFWLLKHPKGGTERVQEVLELLLQKQEKNSIKNIGGWMRWALDEEKKPCTESEKKNLAYSEELAKKYHFVETAEKYVKIYSNYLGTEQFYYHLPEESFRDRVDRRIEKATEHEEVYA